MRAAHLLPLALLGLFAACRHTQPAAVAGTVEILAPYAFAPVIGDEGSAYFTMRNTGAEPDTLIGITVPTAATAMLHGQKQDGSVTRMVMLDALPLPPKAEVRLAPGGYHLMLTGLAPVPKPGDTLQLKLIFARAGAVNLPVPVHAYGDAPAQ
jgi:copper(I)-binding protein